MKGLTLVAAGILALAILSPPAEAGTDLDESVSRCESAPDGPCRTWTFRATLYLWAVSLDGTSSIADQPANVDASFKDIVDNLLEGAFAAHFEAWHRCGLGLITDVYWTDLGLDESITLPGPQGRGKDIELDVRQVDVLVAVGYRLLDMDAPPSPAGAVPHTEVAGRGASVDVYAGARVSYLKEKLKLNPGRNFGGSDEWIEPVIGVRGTWRAADWFWFTARADAGGFGISDLPDTDVFLTFMGRFRLGRLVSLVAGYQWRWFDMSSGSGQDEFGLDATFAGPFLGLTFTF
jgi:hypothetical protein